MSAYVGLAQTHHYDEVLNAVLRLNTTVEVEAPL